MRHDLLIPVRSSSEPPHRLRAAAIGCGSHALRNIFPAFAHAPLDLAAVCDLVPERAEAAARLFGARASYRDAQEMLERERPEIVFVVLSADAEGKPRYPAVAAAVLRAGAHVWIEKPPASSADEVLQMAQASREAGKLVGIGFKKMFAPANVKARQITQRPEFGPVSTLTARYPQSLPPENERGNDQAMAGFLDHIVHPYSVLRLFGGPIESLTVEREGRTEASFTTLRFRSGALGSLHLCAGQSEQSPLERTEVVGQGCNVVIENNLRVVYHRPGATRGEYGRTSSAYGEDDAATLFWEPEFSLGQLYNKGLFLLGYAPEILYFCDCVQKEQAPEFGNLDDALELLRVYEAYRQADGQKVILKPLA